MNGKRVLIVDDEPDIRELLDITITRMGLETVCAPDLQSALTAISKQQPDLCLTDMRLPDGNGLSLIETLQQQHPNIPVAMITAYGSVETAISALKAGAFDFINKPIELDRLRTLVNSALQLSPSPSAEDAAAEDGLTGKSAAIEQLRHHIGRLARSQAPVHIRGESGVGKEVVARLIHQHGPRANGPFVAVNCGAIPAELMESELFGHLKGSFTGAHMDKLGLFRTAKGGTLFLDEVADLPLAMQVKLLRAIQEKSVRPIGSATEEDTDVRVLSATHKDLATEVTAGKFRNDLYYRINVIELTVPPLRERLEDLPLLTEALLNKIAANSDLTGEIDSSALSLLANYHFPGNVRELENILERGLALSADGRIRASDLQFSSTPITAISPPTTDTDTDTPQQSWSAQDAYGDLEGYLENIERDILDQTLKASRWNKTAAAKMLGISFRSLRYRLKKLGIED